MSINSVRRIKEKLQFVSSIAFLLIVTFAIDHCDCDQGKKDTYFCHPQFFVPAPFMYLESLHYCSPLLIVVVGCSFCCCENFCMWIKEERKNEAWVEEEEIFKGVLLGSMSSSLMM
jgi:hypothetical protein